MVYWFIREQKMVDLFQFGMRASINGGNGGRNYRERY
jgi:hypothetical protein